MFEINNLTKQYSGEFALNSVSMKISEGMNFIVGASGSGKTTLLKIISGMESGFDGDVSYCGKSIKDLSNKDKSYFWGNIFGFVWQDFNLLENNTVLENVLLPSYLKDEASEDKAASVLKGLNIFDLASQKVKFLSGGQKQRVAIARELMKNPKVIFADEPTSALDEKTSKATIDVLRKLSKTRTVIVVTHDISLITEKDNVYELDKGELVSSPETEKAKEVNLKMLDSHKFSIKNSFSLAKTNVKSNVARFLISALSLVIASVLLLTTVSGTISGSSQGEFDKLLETYGESLCDISIIKSFTDASGTDGNDKKKPSGDVTQDISGLFEKYSKDERVSFITYLQAFNDIKIKVDGKSYSIESSGSTPVINKLIAGNMPIGDTNEVVVPESFIKKLGILPDQAIGKEIDFDGSIYDWSSGSPVLKKTNSKAKIVGVMDTSATYEYEGKIQSYTVDDSFFFSKSALDSMTKQAGTDLNKQNFLIRAKTPADMIAIKDELNEKGIVPLGRFELVEDMVRLNNQTTEQSGSASVIISLLSIVMVAAIFLITGFMRKKEYAIYKVSGFTLSHLFKLNLAESLLSAISAVIVMFISSPLLDLATKALFGVNILNAKMLFTGALLIIATTILSYFATSTAFVKVNVNKALKTGDR